MTPAEHALRWRGRERWVVLATHVDASRLLALWRHWRDDAQRCGALHLIAMGPAPPARADLAASACEAAMQALRVALIDAWPPLTPDLHTLAFEAGRVQLQLAVGEPARWLRELVAQVDAFEIAPSTTDIAPAEARALARLAAPGAVLAAGALAPHSQRALVSAGFAIDAATAFKTRARYAPAFVATRRAAAPRAASGERRALVVGGGLAGCAVAWALAERGWRSTVFDLLPAPAGGASGNPAGLFHAVVHAHDGVHARLHRIAALQAGAEVEIARREHGVAGSTRGLLRQETRLDLDAMRALLARLRLPVDAVRAVDAAEGEALCGLPRPGLAWFYPGGGWVDPAGLARSYLARAGTACRFTGRTRIERLRRRGTRWQLLDAQDQIIDEADTVVLANAGDAARLAGFDDDPIASVRGQLSWSDIGGDELGVWPRLPLAGPGHALLLEDGRLVFGATRQRGDLDPNVRLADHAANLAQLSALIGRPLPFAVDELQGRTAWRCTARDRLPLIGALPALDLALHAKPTAALAREPGLFVFCALGSRGIAWSALGGRVLAAAVAGGPAPLPAGLLDALDPARFALRALRRTSGARDPVQPAS
ncbi:MAG: FAD-dependent 5-carboxymethylaminomethyl-2-thiouridine(34) oxidoreductase MnmC [Burkholderiaceae bacterium]